MPFSGRQTYPPMVKSNWSIFADIIRKSSQDLSNLNSREETLRATTNTITIIKKAIDAAVPVITPKNRHTPWWTQNLNLLQERLKRAKRRHRADPTEEREFQCASLESAWKRALNHVQRRFWYQKLERSGQSSLWKTVRKHKTHHRPIPPLMGGSPLRANVRY
jgi:hypothetical protein